MIACLLKKCSLPCVALLKTSRRALEIPSAAERAPPVSAEARRNAAVMAPFGFAPARDAAKPHTCAVLMALDAVRICGMGANPKLRFGFARAICAASLA